MYRLLLLAVLFCFSSLSSVHGAGLWGGREKQIIVNNRILANVNGKPITVIDVMKKMDVVFYRHYPEYADNNEARLQFYSVSWKRMLNDLIDKELILDDAKDTKMEVTNGDVRQELENMFGPNIIANLDKLDMSYDEAWGMIKGDITLRRMMYAKVNMKAQRQVTPKEVKTAYDKYAVENRIPSQWIYRVVSVRNPDADKGAEAATTLRNLLVSGTTSVDDLAKNYQNLDNIDKDTKVTFSEEFVHTEEELSDTYKSILVKMTPDTYSEPIAQASRSDKSTVNRIFFLKERKEGGVPPFSEVSSGIRATLLESAIEKETADYFGKLRKKYRVDADDLKKYVSDDFQPFSLK